MLFLKSKILQKLKKFLKWELWMRPQNFKNLVLVKFGNSKDQNSYSNFIQMCGLIDNLFFGKLISGGWINILIRHPYRHWRDGGLKT